MNSFNFIKKGLVSLSVLALSVFASASAAANLGFNDDAQIPSWAEEAIEELMFQGVISGNDDGSFAPARQLNRAEVAKIIVLATGVSCNTPATPTFPDVQPGDWFFDYVECMADYGWINGYPDGMFRPAVGINRAEIAKMVVNAFDIDQDLSNAPHFSDVSPSDWFYGYVETAYNAGVMQGYTSSTFSPASAVTRAETARIVYDAQLFIYSEYTPEYTDGALTVTLSADTPAGVSIPFNATSVPYLTTNFTAAPDADVELGRVIFTRLGLGDNDDFDNCWVEFDGFKVGGEKSVSSDDTVEITFNPPVIVPAGQTLVSDLVCSSEYDNTQNSGSNTGSLDDRNIGHRNRFALIGAEDVLSTALNIVGDFPIEGLEMQVADYAVSNIEFEDLGSNTTVEVGDEYTEIGKFRLLNDSDTNKDIEIRALTFENDGDGDLDEILFDTALYIGGDQVSYETIVDGDYITFRLDDGVTGGYILEDGDSRVFSIRTDIVAAENGDYIELKVDNFEDIVAIEIGTSFGVRAIDEDGNDAEDQFATLARYNIDAGELNISDRSPSSQEYAPGSNEVVLQIVRAVVGQPVEFDGIMFNVASGSFAADKNGNGVDNELADFGETFDNFRLYVNDRLVDTEDNFRLVSGGSDGTMTDYMVEFSTNFELTTTSEIRLVGDVSNDAINGDKIKFRIEADEDFDSPEYISNGDQVPETELLGTAEANFVEVQKSELLIRRTDGFSNGDFIVAGENNVNVMEFTLENNNSGDVNITGITIGAFGTAADESGECQDYYLALFMGGVIQGDAQNLNSDCTADFNDLNNVVVPSNEEIEFTLVVNTEEQLAGDSSSIPTTSVTSPNSELTLAKDINAGTSNINPAYACVTGVAAENVQPGSTIRVYNTDSNAGENGYIYDVEPATGTLSATTGSFSTSTAYAYDCPVGSVAVLTGAIPTTVAVGTEEDRDTVTGASFNFTNDHLMASSMVDLGFDYVVAAGGTTTPYALAAGASLSLYVSDASVFTTGEQVTVTDVASSTGYICVMSTSVNTGADVLVIQPCDAAGAYDAAGILTIQNPLTGATITSVTGSPYVRFAVLDVAADNDENGTEVPVVEASTDLTVAIADGGAAFPGTPGEDCDNTTTAGNTPNALCGVYYSLIDGGKLTVTSQGSVIKSDVLLAKDTDVEVMTLRFRAAYDDIYIEDLHLENDLYDDNTGCTAVYGTVTTTTAPIAPVAGTTVHYGDSACESNGADLAIAAFTGANGETAENSLADYSDIANRMEFKLYDSNNNLIKTTTMDPTTGKLHFKLDGNEVVVPKGESEIVSVRVDLYDIDDDAVSGMRLKLSLDSSESHRGIEAESGAQGGDDLDTPEYGNVAGVLYFGWEDGAGTATSEDFVVYRTEPTVKPTSYQNDGFASNVAGFQEIYRFQISADATNDIEVGRITTDISMTDIGIDAVAAGYASMSEAFKVYEVSGGSVDLSTVILDGTVVEDIEVYAFGSSDPTTAVAPADGITSMRVAMNFYNEYANGVSVDKGTTRTFALYAANLGDTSCGAAPCTGTIDTEDDTITVYMARDDEYVGSMPMTTLETLTYPVSNELLEFIWSDIAESDRSSVTTDWHNGYLVDIDTNATTVGN